MLVLVVKNFGKKQQLYLVCEYHVRREESENTATIFTFLCSRFSVFFVSIYSTSPFSVLLGFQSISWKARCSCYETKLDFLDSLTVCDS